MVAVRVPAKDMTVLSTALDAGASAIVIPHCESVESVKAMLDEIYYRKQSQRYTLKPPC